MPAPNLLLIFLVYCFSFRLNVTWCASLPFPATFKEAGTDLRKWQNMEQQNRFLFQSILLWQNIWRHQDCFGAFSTSERKNREKRPKTIVCCLRLMTAIVFNLVPSRGDFLFSDRMFLLRGQKKEEKFYFDDLIRGCGKSTVSSKHFVYLSIMFCSQLYFWLFQSNKWKS